MPKFNKLIVTPGTHKVGRLDGRTEVVPITEDRIRTWVENTNKAKKLGIKIPAPFAHQDANKNFPLPVVLGTDGASLADAYNGNGLSWDAQVNGGFWEDDFTIDPETKGLAGIVDAPGDEKDPNTQAGKIGTVVKETSVFVMGPRKVIVNGVEHEIGEHLAHVAMCLHPAQPGQRNFEPLSTDQIKGEKSLELAMSFCMADLVGSGAQGPGSMGALGNTLPDPTKPRDAELVNCLAMLRNVCFIDLPEETDRNSFVTNLSLALRQKRADQQETQRKEESMTQRPDGTETKSPSIAMSNLLNGQPASTPNNAPVINVVHAPTSADTMLALMMSNIVTTKKDSIKKRIAALVATGRVKKDYADQKLYPRVEVLAMSTAQLEAAKGDVNQLRDPIEDLVEALEATAPLTGGSVLEDEGYSFSTPPGAETHDLPADLKGPEQDLTDAESDAIIGDSLSMVGM